MKATLTLLIFLVAAVFAQAQMVPVTFAVDMNDVDEFDPANDTVRVAGSFQGWTPRSASNENILRDGDGDGVYQRTIDVVPGPIQFKYVINIWNGNPRGFNENTDETPFGDDTDCLDGDGNRVFTVADGADLPLYEYNSCEVSDLTISSTRGFSELRGVTVGPNPATDYATVALPAGGSYDVRVMDVGGRVMSEVNGLAAASYEIAGVDFPAGLYLVEVVDAARGERAVLRVSFQ